MATIRLIIRVSFGCVFLLLSYGCALWDDVDAARSQMEAGQREVATLQLERLARFGDVNAMLLLADAHRSSRFGDKNMQLASEWYRRAAATDSPKAKRALARFLINEGDTSLDGSAYKLLLDAWHAGERNAAIDIAEIYLANSMDPSPWTNRVRRIGKNSRAQLLEADWLRLAGDRNLAAAQYRRLLKSEPGALPGLYAALASDDQRALLAGLLDGLEHSAVVAHPKGLYQLARDLEAAEVEEEAQLLLYDKAANELPQAGIRLAKRYVALRAATPDNIALVKEVLDDAALTGYRVPALALHGKLHFSGKFLDKDPQQAERLLAPIASVHGESSYLLAELHRRGLLGSADDIRARELALTALALGESKAKRTLEKLNASN